MTSDTAYSRPQTRLAPNPTAESTAFWTGGRNGALLITLSRLWALFPSTGTCMLALPEHRRRTGARFRQGHRRRLHRQSAAVDTRARPSVHRGDGGAADEPDVRLITNIVDVSLDDIRVGLPVEVFFEDWTAISGEEENRVWLPLFRPVG